jgi:hypothetical protein
MALLALIALVLTGLLGRDGAVQVGAADPPPELTGAVPRPVDLVYAFGAALRDGEPEIAASLVAAEWTQLELPGLPWRFLERPGDRADLATALGFYSDLVDVDVADCRVQSRTLSDASAQVVCDTSVSSAFAEVGRVAGRVIPTTYWIEDDEISGILRSHLGTPMIESYCHWAERQGGSPLFDADCSLTVGSRNGEAHLELAHRYLAAGRPGAGRAYRAGRSGISVVGVLVSQHNQEGAPEVLTDPDASGAAAPGVLGGKPQLGAFLDWSKVVYRIELGSCIVDGSRSPIRFGIDCPEARWSGPLLSGLTLDPVMQAVSFRVESATVRSMSGSTDRALQMSWQRFCSWVTTARPEAAATVLEDCVPVYTAKAGRALLTLVAEYAADPR